MTEVDKIIDALKGLEQPLSNLWGYAIKANYVLAMLDFLWVIGLVILSFVLKRLMPSLDKEGYDYMVAFVTQKIIYYSPLFVAALILTHVIFRLLAPEVQTIKDIVNYVGNAA